MLKRLVAVVLLSLMATSAFAHFGDQRCQYNGCFFYNDAHWNLDRIDQYAPIHTNRAYHYWSTGYGVRAYIVDYGVLQFHEEFGSRVEPGRNFMDDPQIADYSCNNGNNPCPSEEISTLDFNPATAPCQSLGGVAPGNYNASHGTGVASVIGGRTTGSAPGVTIVPVKVAECNEFGTRAPSKQAVARGLEWIRNDVATRGGRAVVIMSIHFPLGINPQTGFEYQGVRDMCESRNPLPGEPDVQPDRNCIDLIEQRIRELIAANIPVVVSANNQDRDACNFSPSRLGSTDLSSPHVITVGGTMYTTNADGSHDDARWVQPGDAQNPGSNWGPCVSLYAPAWRIPVAHANATNAYRTEYDYGTSWAAPLVGGLVARLLQNNPTMSVTAIWNHLYNKAHRIGRNLNPPQGGYNDMIAHLDFYD